MAKTKTSRTGWGTGKKYGSFIPVIERLDVSYYILAVWTYGTVEIYFQYLKENEPFSDNALRIELLRRLNDIPGVTLPDDAITRRPSIPLAVLAQGDAMAKFLAILDWVASQIEAYDMAPADGGDPGQLPPA
jgi:hypothetical protein